MGESLIGADGSNPWGHYEDREASLINRWILRQAGGDWRHVPSRQAIAAVNADARIAAFIDKRDAQHEVYGLKDPRLALTIDLWTRHLAYPIWIRTVRPLEESAASLVKRNGMKLVEAKALTGEYEWRLFSFLARRGHFSWWHNNAMANPHGAVDSLASYLDIKPTPEAVAHIRVATHA
jgi:hypothetical protein